MGRRVAEKKRGILENISSSFKGISINFRSPLLILLMALIIIIAISSGVYLLLKSFSIKNHSQASQAAQEKINERQIIETFNKGDYKTVIAKLEKYLVENKASASKANNKLREILASSYLMVGDSQKAMSQYQDMLKADPNNPETLYRIGVLLQLLGQQNEAIGYLSRATEAAPDVILFHVELARANAKAKNYNNSIEQWKAVLNLLPPADKSRASILAEMANIYILQRDLVQAQGIIATGLALDPDNEALKALESKISRQNGATPLQGE